MKSNLTLVLCLFVTQCALAQEKSEGGKAERYTAPDGFLKSLPAGPELKPEDAADRTAGFS